MAAPSAMSSTIGTRLFSTLDDGTGYTTVDNVLDAWMEEGIENSPEILQVTPLPLTLCLNLGLFGGFEATVLYVRVAEMTVPVSVGDDLISACVCVFVFVMQALDFDLEGKLSLRELTVALENELLITKNGIHQAALASFKAEIRHLL